LEDEPAWADNNFIDPKATALLSMDFQVSNVEGLAGNEDVLLDRMTRLLGAARNARVMVIYVVVGFRPGHPEISNNNMSFLATRRRRAFDPGLSGTISHVAGQFIPRSRPKTVMSL
jgi:nicotinamidase-related amidase